MAPRFSISRFCSAPPLERVQSVSRGLPAEALREVVADDVVTLTDVARVVSPRRTLQRRLSEDERLTPEESDRLARFMMILQLATRVFEDRSVAMGWLSQPKRNLDGKVPLDLMKSDIGSRLVEEVLEQARHGFAS